LWVCLDSRVESLQLLYLFEVQRLFSAKPLTGAASIKPEVDEIMESTVEVLIELLQYGCESFVQKIRSDSGFPVRVNLAMVLYQVLPGLTCKSLNRDQNSMARIRS
jgi:hypothetical protein